MSGNKQVGLSGVAAKFMEAVQLRTKATFWFGALLSLAEEADRRELHDDCSASDKAQMLRVITHAVVSISAFYEQERPDSVYKLFTLAQQLVDWLSSQYSLETVLTSVSYLNTLAVYAIKTRQYPLALDLFSQIYSLYTEKPIDTTQTLFLAALNNYLAFLKKSHQKQANKLVDVQSALKDLWVKLLAKAMMFDRSASMEEFSGIVTLLTGVYSQQKWLFEKYEKDLHFLVANAMNVHVKARRKMPEDMVEYLLKEKVHKNIVFKMEIHENQLRFYSRKPWGQPVQNRLSLPPPSPIPEGRLSKIETMLEQSVDMLNEQKVASARYATLQPSVDLSNKRITTQFTSVDAPVIRTIEAEPIKSTAHQTLQPSLHSSTRRRRLQKTQQKKPMRPTKAHPKRLAPTTFKIHSIFLEVNQDGLLLSDYTKENKRYIEWNTFSLILQRIELHFPIEEITRWGVATYYDAVRLLSPFLKRGANRQIMVVTEPQPLLQVNELIKLYRQEGKCLKLALMNQYDTFKFVGVIDCFISEYDQFLRKLNDNEYLTFLNQQLASQGSAQHTEGHFLLDYVKRNRETTVAELSNQLMASSMETVLTEKGALYKCLFILKNNKQLYFKILDNITVDSTFTDDFVISVRIQDLFGYQHSYNLYTSIESDQVVQPPSNRISRGVQIPISKLTYYFPPNNMVLREYLSLYARMIADMLNDFEASMQQVNLGAISFAPIVHVSRTETIEYGKYMSLVSAELVGSRERIWALVIRFYDLAHVISKVTVLMNPYHDFMAPVIEGRMEEKQNLLRNLLLDGSVKETYLYLKRTKMLEKRCNLFDYLIANSMI